MGGLDGPPKPPALGDAPAKPWRPSGLLRGLGGLDGPPKPPALGDAPAKPWRPSGLLRGLGGLDGPPKPPALGDAPAKPWRPSGLLRGFGGLDGALLGIASRFRAPDTAPQTGPRSDAARQSSGAPRSGGAIAGGAERAP